MAVHQQAEKRRPGKVGCLCILLLAVGGIWVCGRFSTTNTDRLTTAIPKATIPATTTVALPREIAQTPEGNTPPVPSSSPTTDMMPTPIPHRPQGTVTTSALNMRQGPGMDFRVVAQLRQGDRVTLLDEHGDWLYVQSETGLIGWVAARYVTFRSFGEETSPTPTPMLLPVTSLMQEGQVVAVTDGDTIRVLLGGQEYTVRYIGIDAPEINSVEGVQARQQNEALVSGKTVRLEKDVSEMDRYGRLLRYVWIGNLMVNAEMVRLGYAQAASYPPDVKHQELFVALQKEAEKAGRGLWGAVPTARTEANLRAGPGTNYPVVGSVKAKDVLVVVARNAAGDWYQLSNGAWIAASLVSNAPASLPVVTPMPTPITPPTVRAPASSPGRQCDPCYPDVCIPLVSYDLDCKDVPFCRFRVTCDPHRFDGDHDGIGCEVCR